MRFLDDVFEKTSTSMFSAMFRKTQNIMLTMHISDVFQTIKKILKNVISFSNANYTVNIRKFNSIFVAWKSYIELNCWLNNQTFVMALYGVPKTENIMENIVLFP